MKARLEGHSFDLDTLADLFKDGMPYVASDDDGHYITSPSLDGDGLFQDGGLLRETAEALVRRANGIARALQDGFRPVRLTGRFTSSDGKQHHVVVLDTVEVRDTAHAMNFVVGGAPRQPPQSPAPAYYEAADAHADAREVLDLLGKEVVALGWIDLYKIYEIVRSNVGNDRVLFTKNWVPAADLKAFTASANLPAISGPEGRHARNGTGVPKRTMTLPQARNTISLLVVAWLNSL